MVNTNTPTALIDIDGGVLEGGGQVLRIAVALSVLQKLPIRVHSIRAGRPKPGLRPQHLKGLEIGQQICGGKLIGAHIGSTDITFYPGTLSCTQLNADTQTAGSVSLLLQVGLPCALFNPSGPTHFQLRGGTNAEMAPHVDYTSDVFKPLLEKFGGMFDVDIVKRGYFPRGGGEVHATVHPVSQLKAVEMMEPGEIDFIQVCAFAAGKLLIDMAKQMANSATKLIAESRKTSARLWNRESRLETDWRQESPGKAIGSQLCIMIVGRTNTGCIFGSCAVVPGEKGTNFVAVARKAAADFMEDIQSGSCVDRWAQDQIIILMAVAKGKSRIRCGEITLHTKTAIHIAELLTEAKFTISQDTDSNIIQCDGIGFTYKN